MSEWDQIVEKLWDSNSHVRKSALEMLAGLDPDRSDQFARRMLKDSDRDVVNAAIQVLCKRHAVEEVAQMALEPLTESSHASAEVLLEFILESTADLTDRALGIAMDSTNWLVRQQAVRFLSKRGDEKDVEEIRRMLSDDDEQVRLAAFEGWVDQNPPDLPRVATSMLRDSSWEVRRKAIWSLEDVEDPTLVDSLLPLARDDDEDVRRAAIEALAKFDDARVLCELMSSLDDVDAEVAGRAEEILSGEKGNVPSLSRYGEGLGAVLWQVVRAKVDNVNRWAARIGQELLGKPVKMQNYRQGLGRTHFSRKEPYVTIEVSDTPITSGHVHGEDIMRGLVLHEIGHHLSDFGQRGYLSTRGKARSEGLGDIFDILLDERLERQLRARRRQWGVFFDRLASYAFAQSEHQVPLSAFAQLVGRSVDDTLLEIRNRRLPGKVLVAEKGEAAGLSVQLCDHEMLLIPGLVPRMTAFLAYLRCGFDPRLHPDPRVAQAVALVPHDLKDLPHRDLLVVARKIGKLIGKQRETKRETRRLEKRLRRFPNVLKGLRDALDRAVETGQAPGRAATGAEGIRKTPTPSSTSSDQVTIVTARDSRRDGMRVDGRPSKTLNLGAGIEYEELPVERGHSFDPTAHAELLHGLRKHCRRLRWYFERLATKHVEEYASRTGRRLDLAQVRNIAIGGKLGILVRGYEVIGADAYVGILVDQVRVHGW